MIQYVKNNTKASNFYDFLKITHAIILKFILLFLTQQNVYLASQVRVTLESYRS